MAAMTLTYRYPAAVAGGAVAPTAAQAKFIDAIQVDIACGAGANDDATPITHNFGLPVADGSNGTPVLIFTMLAQGTAAKVPSFAFTNLNTVTVTAAAKGANCDFTGRLYIWRPGTQVQ